MADVLHKMHRPPSCGKESDYLTHTDTLNHAHKFYKTTKFLWSQSQSRKFPLENQNVLFGGYRYSALLHTHLMLKDTSPPHPHIHCQNDEKSIIRFVALFYALFIVVFLCFHFRSLFFVVICCRSI